MTNSQEPPERPGGATALHVILQLAPIPPPSLHFRRVMFRARSSLLTDSSHTPLLIPSFFLEHKDGAIEQSSLCALTAPQHLVDQTLDP